MDCRDGRIHPAKTIADLPEEIRRNLIPMELEPTEEQQLRGYVAKYDPCPCGSGEKFKFCCWKKKPGDQELEQLKAEFEAAYRGSS